MQINLNLISILKYHLHNFWVLDPVVMMSDFYKKITFIISSAM